MGKCPVEKVKLDRMNLDEQPLATRQLFSVHGVHGPR